MKAIERLALVAGAALLLLGNTTAPGAQETKNLQQQLDEIRGALPKFAMFIREVGDRFQGVYVAANSGSRPIAADQGLGHRPRSEAGMVPK